MKKWTHLWWSSDKNDPLIERLRREAPVMLPPENAVLHQQLERAVADASIHPAASTLRQWWWLAPLSGGVAAVLAVVGIFYPPNVSNRQMAQISPTPLPASTFVLPAMSLPDSVALVQPWVENPLKKEWANLQADAQTIMNLLPIELVRL